MLFDNFTSRFIEVNGATIHCRIGGNGPPLLLLHGCPQTHVMWHKVAPALSRHFTVIASDLRGYGDSSKPLGSPDHANYSFRAMAADQVTAFLYGQTDRTFATTYWEWFFFVQERDFPEKLLAANPEAFLRYELGELVDSGAISHEVWSEYLRALSTESAMHGMCEDYRAGATIDLEHDAADSERRVRCPLMVLWGDRNPVWGRFDMLGVWRQFAPAAVGSAVHAGHYLAEESPDQVLAKLLPFLNG
jgi:haloacetate dehalogenase